MIKTIAGEFPEMPNCGDCLYGHEEHGHCKYCLTKAVMMTCECAKDIMQYVGCLSYVPDGHKVKLVYKYPEKHPKNCDNCKCDKKRTLEWSCNSGCEYEVIFCPIINDDVSSHYGNRGFIDAVGCPVFVGESNATSQNIKKN